MLCLGTRVEFSRIEAHLVRVFVRYLFFSLSFPSLDLLMLIYALRYSKLVYTLR